MFSYARFVNLLVHLLPKTVKERPHGFRSSFDTWCAETQDVSSQVSKAALGHTFENKVGRAYRRTDFLDRRRALMELWANHVTALGEKANGLAAQ